MAVEEKPMFFWDYTYLLLIPPLLLAFYAQAKVRGTYAKFSRVAASSGISGAEMAREILNTGGANHVPVEETAGQLSDHYDPRKKVLRLSSGVYESRSIAALGIAAHEAGHALQHHAGYVPLHLRNGIYPVASFGSTLAFPLFLIGFFLSSKGPNVLMDIGIMLFAGAVLFSVLTLPVEFNASKRAMTLLGERGYLKAGELDGARRVLSAAALTYIASTAMAAMQLLRMFMLRQSRD
jgi:Zn-dependent membrane protease YugP